MPAGTEDEGERGSGIERKVEKRIAQNKSIKLLKLFSIWRLKRNPKMLPRFVQLALCSTTRSKYYLPLS